MVTLEPHSPPPFPPRPGLPLLGVSQRHVIFQTAAPCMPWRSARTDSLSRVSTFADTRRSDVSHTAALASFCYRNEWPVDAASHACDIYSIRSSWHPGRAPKCAQMTSSYATTPSDPPWISFVAFQTAGVVGGPVSTQGVRTGEANNGATFLSLAPYRPTNVAITLSLTGIENFGSGSRSHFFFSGVR